MAATLRTLRYAAVAALGMLSGPLAGAALYPDAEAARALQPGQQAPGFTVRHVDGSPFVFSPKHLDKPYVLIFYRGGWCPYCNLQLADLHLVEPKLRAEGFGVIFISTDRPQLLYSSLKDPDIDYTLLSDPQLAAAQAFHIAFHLNDQAYARQLQLGVDLEKTTGTTLHALPVPSVFIVDRSGKIRFVYSNPDFRVRLKAPALWRAALPFAPHRPE